MEKRHWDPSGTWRSGTSRQKRNPLIVREEPDESYLENVSMLCVRCVGDVDMMCGERDGKMS